MSKAFSRSGSNLTINLDKLKEKRFSENPPLLLLPATTALGYMSWMDGVLANLKRHPDFNFQFLTSSPNVPSDPLLRLRYDEIYEFIKDKLDFTISINPTLQHLVSQYSTIYQINICM